MYLVTGASGHVGGEVIRALLAAGEPVRALSRDGKATGLPDAVDVVAGDLTNPDSLAEALGGVDGVFVLPGYPGVSTAAAQAGVGAIVALSGTSVETGDETNPISAFMMASEAEVRATGVRWTILRPYDFMANALRWLPQLQVGDVVREPFADVPVAMIDPYDIAAVAVLALRSPAHADHVYTLSGPEQLLAADRVRILGQVLGRSLRLVPLNTDEAREQLSKDQPPEYVTAMFGFYVDKTINVTEVRPDLAALLGRPGRTFEQWATAHSDEFTATK